jgi:glycosyltransferase involved in cell wall biosynthesis
VNALNHLCEEYDFSITIVAYPVVADAPFKFDLHSNITLLRREEYTGDKLFQLTSEKEYDIIYCGGWFDKEYLQLIKKNQHIKSVIAFDKQWLGTIRDYLGVIFLRLKVTKLFDYAFVPGLEQEQFALYAGFKKKQICTGLYICETGRFKKVYSARKTESPKNHLIYAGRYAKEKQIDVLWDCFIEVAHDFPEWQLHCIGTGPLSEVAVEHPQIVHHGFLQPAELSQVMINGAIFILPSLYEPWGVVVNEFAIAGYPLILSDKVGARTALLSKENGWLFSAGNKEQLKAVLRQAMGTSKDRLLSMGNVSHNLSSKLDEKQYAQTLLRMIESN